MASYIIVTESGNDLPVGLAEKYGIYVAPMHVTFDGVSHDDGFFPTTEIIKNFNTTKELPKTSGCTPADFSKVFEELFTKQPDAEVIYLAYSAKTTCSFESCRTIVENLPQKNQVHMFDMEAVASAGALIVEAVAEKITADSSISFKELTAYIEDLCQRNRFWFVPGGLEYLRAGGRLSNAAYLGASLLRIKPTIEMQNGELVATGKHRGSMEKAVFAMINDFMTTQNIDLACCNLTWGEGLSNKLKEKITAHLKELGFQKIQWIQSGGVIFSHSGPGSFAITAFVKE